MAKRSNEMRKKPGEMGEWDDWAADYREEMDHLVEINDSFLLSHIDYKGKTVLDVGGGVGRFAQKIAGQAKQVTLLDYSEAMLDQARQTLEGCDNVAFESLDFETDDINGKYDTILAFSIMHHIKKPKDIIEKFRSCLSPGGQIVILDRIEAGLDKKLRYNLQMVRQVGIKNTYRSFTNKRLQDHVSDEIHPTYDAFCSQYSRWLDGITFHIINHIYIAAIWTDSRS